MCQTDPGITLSRRLQQEPADKSDPESPEAGSREVAINAERDKTESDRLTNSRRSPRRPIDNASLPPNQRPQYTAAVERISGNEIKGAQSYIDVSKPGQDSAPWSGGRPAKHLCSSQANEP